MVNGAVTGSKSLSIEIHNRNHKATGLFTITISRLFSFEHFLCLETNHERGNYFVDFFSISTTKSLGEDFLVKVASRTAGVYVCMCVCMCVILSSKRNIIATSTVPGTRRRSAGQA